MKRRRLTADILGALVSEIDEAINDSGTFKGKHDIMLVVVPRKSENFEITYIGTVDRQTAAASLKYLLAKLEGQSLEVGHA